MESRSTRVKGQLRGRKGPDGTCTEMPTVDTLKAIQQSAGQHWYGYRLGVY